MFTRSTTASKPRSEHEPATDTDLTQTDVLVVGLGEVGRPLLEVLSRAYLAEGRDIEDRVFERVGVLHLCFPFGKEFVASAVHYVREYQPELVIVNSTVAPGTTRAIHTKTRVPTVYSPVRGKHTRMGDELRIYSKFVAGSSAEAVAHAEEHFTAAGIQTRQMSSFEVLELAKLLETTYFGLLIAWAQEMDRFNVALGTDYREVTQFFDEIGFLPSVHFEPGFIGGHCVMPNLTLLEQVRGSLFVETIRKSNDLREAEWHSAGRSFSQRLAPRSLAEKGDTLP
jgi:UDP-N-acetyl-D-mannosaminuronate dehydrogenase